MPGKKLSDDDLKHFDGQLRIMLTVLHGDMEHLQVDALGDGQRVELQGDEGEGYAAEFSLELLQRDEKTAQDVIDAIARLETGTFGRCTDCENWLMKDRLRAMPHARRCISCQREAEANQF
jgi:DnaK suppressor protein